MTINNIADLKPIKLRMVMVETSHPGNIGAAARALKNMCLTELVLVNPHDFPSATATARAAGADTVLQNARVVQSLPEAVAGCTLVVGTTARTRDFEWPIWSPREAAESIVAHATENVECAIVFGRESSGLTNEELESCNGYVSIPANPEYSSLNIAAAMQVLAYEVLQARLVTDTASSKITPRENPLATADELDAFYQHFEQALRHTGFYDPENPRYLMRRMRRIFNEAAVDNRELAMLRGICTSILDLPESPYAKK